MGDSRAFPGAVRTLREQLDEGKWAVVIKVQAGAEAQVKVVGSDLEDPAAKVSCFLCEGVRYIPVTERAELGPRMFNMEMFPGDWATCPECNAAGVDPMRQ